MRTFTIIISLFITLGPTQANADSECAKKLQEFFDKISSKEMADLLITEKKAALVQAFLNNSTKSSQSTDKDGAYFNPRYPRQLTDEEKQKTVHERISEKYIGRLPRRIDDMISYFTHQEEYIKKNAAISNRLLLAGYPGTGKTYLFEVLAQELQMPAFYFPASIFADKYIGEASRKIHKAFESARELNRPVLIFIDEIDALATQRTDSTHDENRRTLSALLTELQAVEGNKNIFIICATNDINALDRAFRDRFPGESESMIWYAGEGLRSLLFMKFFKDNDLPQDKKLADRLAKVTTDGFSNRELKDIVSTAKFKKIKDCQDFNRCDEELCAYLRYAIDTIGKNTNYARYWGAQYCRGI